MSDQWHYMRGGNQGGPVSAAEIRNLAASGRLAPTDLVWNDGMTDWTPLERVPGLMGGAPAGGAATPYASPTSMPPPVKGQRRYGRIQGLVLSLGSGPFYRDVARNWGGIGMLYLLMLLTVTWIPLLVKIQVSFNQFVRDDVPKALKDFPTITIQGGKASSPAPQPFEIKDPDTGKAMFVMDTTGKFTSLDQTPAIVLLTETKLFVRSQHKVDVHDLREFPDMTISKEWIQSWFDAFAPWLAVVAFPLVMFGSIVRALIMILICGAIGMIFNNSNRAGLSFDALLRLAAVGMTLSVYVDTVLELAGVTVPFWFLIAAAMTTGYVAFGVKAAITEEPAAV
jgi:hypothetical protein